MSDLFSQLSETQQYLRRHDGFETPATGDDGWALAPDTWVYASANTFTVTRVPAADVTYMFPVGCKVRLKQGGAYKYFYCVAAVYAAGVNTITIAAGTSYTLVNAPITDNYYSYASTPRGWPTTFGYTPTVTPSAGVITAYTANGYFQIHGRTVVCWGIINVTDNGTGAGRINFSTPPIVNTVTSRGAVYGWSYLTTLYALTGIVIGAAANLVRLYKYDGTYPAFTGCQLWLGFNYDI